MSIWATVTGKVEINQNAKVSIRTCIKEMFGEVCIGNVNQDKHPSRNTIIHDIDFHFDGDGLNAATHIEKFVDAIRQYDKTAVVELEASIRFM